MELLDFCGKEPMALPDHHGNLAVVTLDHGADLALVVALGLDSSAEHTVFI